MVSAESNTELN